MKEHIPLTDNELAQNNQTVNNEMLVLVKELNEKMMGFVQLCNMYDTPDGRLGDEYIEDLNEVMNEKVIECIHGVVDNAMFIAAMSRKKNMYV